MIHDPHHSSDAMRAPLPRSSGFDARTPELGVFDELLPRFVNTAGSITTLRCAVAIWVCQAGGSSLGADRSPSVCKDGAVPRTRWIGRTGPRAVISFARIRPDAIVAVSSSGTGFPSGGPVAFLDRPGEGQAPQFNLDVPRRSDATRSRLGSAGSCKCRSTARAESAPCARTPLAGFSGRNCNWSLAFGRADGRYVEHPNRLYWQMQQIAIHTPECQPSYVLASTTLVTVQFA